MSIEIALLISGISVAFAIYSGIIRIKREEKRDNQQEAAQLTTVIVKLENLGNGISEIKNELLSLKNDTRELRDRIITVEQSTKQAHKRIDEITGKGDNQ
jgi:predicted RNase H-like nuclease (RuvC/YqgF family)